MAREDHESFFKFCSEADVRCPCQSHHVCQSRRRSVLHPLESKLSPG